MGAMWGEMPIDLATKIAEHLEYHEDFLAFGDVCSRWKSAARESKFRATKSYHHNYLQHDHHHKIPWLMLPDRQDTSCLQRCFHSVCRRQLHHVPLPLPNHINFLSSRGWLLSFSSEDKDIFLFSPFSGSVIKLPSLFSHVPKTYYDKFILSADPSTTKDFGIALMFLDGSYYPEERVAIWWNGDRGWFRISSRVIYRVFNSLCNDIIFYREEFYAVDSSGLVLSLRNGKDPPFKGKGIPRQVAKISFSDARANHSMFYLVESDSRLLVIYRGMKVHYPVINEKLVDPLDGASYVVQKTSEELKEIRTLLFRAFEVNIDTGETNEVQCLGNRSLFLGLNSSFSIQASAIHGCKPNSIYYADSYLSSLRYEPGYRNLGPDLGIYNFSSKKIESYDDGLSLLKDVSTPPLWVEPLLF